MLYIIRHGKTDWNLKHKLQGRTDIPLNEEGRQMAIEAGARYKDTHFEPGRLLSFFLREEISVSI